MPKRLHEMQTYPTTEQVFSFMAYAMKHWPESMTGLHEAYEGSEQDVVSWCTGFTYALALVNDNGCPSDLDAVLESWTSQTEVFRIGEALAEYRRHR